jgi:hypothetical protein
MPSNLEQHRKRNREWLRRRSKDPEWRACRNARQKEWARNKRNDSMWLERRRERDRKRGKRLYEKWRKNPEWVERTRARHRELNRIRAKDPEWRERKNKRLRERRATDPIYRAEKNLYLQEWLKKHKQDPAYQAALEQQRTEKQAIYKERREQRYQRYLAKMNERRRRDPIYRERNVLRQRELRRERIKNPANRAKKNAYQKEYTYMRYSLGPEYREHLNKYSRDRQRKLKLDPVYREYQRELQRKWKEMKRQDPLYRMRERLRAVEYNRANPEKRYLTHKKRAVRKKLLKDPNYQQMLNQAVLAQLEQLGFPASVLRGVFP